jgi:heme-degrading monooxygenase HmoA
MTTFEFESKEGQSEMLLSFFKKILPETRLFSGNKGTKVSRLSKTKFIIITYWEHENNVEEYLDWREKKGDFSILLSFLIQAPTIVTYEVLKDV